MCLLTHTNDLLAHLIIRPTRHTGSSLRAVLAYDFSRRSQQNGALRASAILHKYNLLGDEFANDGVVGVVLRALSHCRKNDLFPLDTVLLALDRDSIP